MMYSMRSGVRSNCDTFRESGVPGVVKRSFVKLQKLKKGQFTAIALFA